MQTTQPRTNILALAAVITITLTLAADSLYAVWSAPTTNPPDGNVATPIHTGSVNQVKGGDITAGEGRIGANQFVAFDKMRAAEYCGLEEGSPCVPSADLGGGGAVATNTVNSDRYCDENGNNCFWPENINNRTAIYLCPKVISYIDMGRECATECYGQLTTKSSCKWVPSGSNYNCVKQLEKTESCSFAGYIVQ